jgi:hypothetical protein
MRLSITIGSLTLATESDAVSELRLGGEIATEVLRGLRAPLAKPVNRGNHLDTVSFSVTRTHESLVEAQKHLVSHYLKFRNLFAAAPTAPVVPGTILYNPVATGIHARFAWDSGSVYAPYLLNATPESLPEGTHTGVTTIFNYTLRGNWSESAPVTTNITTEV